MLIENRLPGLEPWDKIAAAPTTWHINFHQSPNTPELLIAGREEAYFREQFFEDGVGAASAVQPEAMARYACAYRGASRLEAGLGQYRGAQTDAKFNASTTSPTSLGLVLVGGEKAFGPQMPTMARDLRGRGWSNITVEQIAGGSHYLLDERPDEMADLIVRFAAAAPPGRGRP